MNNTEYNEILNTNSNHNTIAIIEDGRIVTYNNLIANINKLSIYLNELNLNIKDRICILLPNSIEYIICYYAINKLGAIIVPIDYNFKENTINHIIDDSSASFIISNDNNLKLLSKKNKLLKRLKIDNEIYINIFSTKKSFKNIHNNKIDKNASLITYTTGTTGLQKGVVLTNNSTILATQSINNIMQIPKNTIEIIAMPLSKSFGLARMRCVFEKCGTIILVNGLLNPAIFIKQILDNNAIGFGLVPSAMRVMMLKFSKYLKELSSQIKYIEMGSAYFGSNEKIELQKMMPKTKIFMHYGLTESSRSTFLNFNNLKKINSIGRPSPGVSVIICDDNFNKVSANTIGNILIKSDWMTIGYWMIDNKNLYHKGWLITDDIGKIDNDGYLYYVSRKSDIIVHQGYKFSPKDIEKVLNQTEIVTESCAILISVPQEMIIAFCVSDHNELDKKYLKKICRENLEHFKVPEKFILCDQIKKTNSGKLKRKYMKEKYFGKNI